MRQFLNPLRLVAIFLSLFTVCPVQAQSPAPLRIGVILPLTGDGASTGAAVRNGMMLALEKLPRAVREQMQIYYEDDALQPKQTLAAYRELRQMKDIQAVVSLSSSTSKSLAPLTDLDQIPQIAIATDPKVVQGRKWVVNFWVTAEEEARLAAAEAVKRGYKRIARISSIHDFPLAMKEHFDKARAGRIQIALDEDYAPDNKDFRTYLAKLRQQKDMDAVLMVLMPGQLGVFAKQLRASGINLPMFGIETFEELSEVQASEGALIGQWYVNTDDPNHLFIDEFKARFPKSSLYGASNGHDIMLLLGSAVEHGYRTTAQVNQYLHTLKDFTGALGAYSASGDNRFTLPAAVKIVTKDGFEKIAE